MGALFLPGGTCSLCLEGWSLPLTGTEQPAHTAPFLTWKDIRRAVALVTGHPPCRSVAVQCPETSTHPISWHLDPEIRSEPEGIPGHPFSSSLWNDLDPREDNLLPIAFVPLAGARVSSTEWAMIRGSQ